MYTTNEPLETESGRPIRRRESGSAEVTDDDVKIALEMQANGTPIPASLEPAVAAYKAKNGGAPAAGDDDDDSPDDDTEDGEEGEPKGSGDPAPVDGEDDDEDDEDPDAPAAGEKGKAPKESDDGAGDEDDDDDEGDGRSPKPIDQRPVRTIPIGKFQHAKKTWKDRESELTRQLEDRDRTITELSAAVKEKSSADVEKQLSELSEKTGIPVDSLKPLVDYIKGSVALPKELIDRINSVGAAAPSEKEQEEKFWKQQDENFNRDFDAALKEPGVDKGMAAHKEAIRELAFTKGYERKSIWEIYTRFVKPAATRKGAPPESPTHTPSTTGEKRWREIANDPAAIAALSIADAEKFTEWMGNQGSREIRRVTRSRGN